MAAALVLVALIFFALGAGAVALLRPKPTHRKTVEDNAVELLWRAAELDTEGKIYEADELRKSVNRLLEFHEVKKLNP